jgi:hypothetical protein
MFAISNNDCATGYFNFTIVPINETNTPREPAWHSKSVALENVTLRK